MPNEVAVPSTEVVNPAGNELPAGGGAAAVEVKPVQLKDDDLVEVVVDGKPQHLKWAEARGGFQRQQDYTRKTQHLSTREKEVEQIYNTVVAKQKEVSEREAILDTVLGRVDKSKQQAPDQFGDEEVLTGKQARELLASKERELSERFDRQLTSKLDEFGQRQTQAVTFQRWDDMTNKAVEQLTKEHPVLERIPGLVMTLKQMAAKETPTTDRELVDAIVHAGQTLAKSLDDAYKETAKEAAATKKRLLEDRAPQKPGGGTKFEQPKKTYTQGRKVKWSELEADVEAALEGLDE